MFTVDASVHLNALNPQEERSAESRALLQALHGQPLPVFAPLLLLVEVAAGVARARNDNRQAVALAATLRSVPGQVLVPLDDHLADAAARLAAAYRLRGSDAVYAAVAEFYGTTLITLDRQQRERLPATIATLTPDQALARLLHGPPTGASSSAA